MEYVTLNNGVEMPIINVGTAIKHFDPEFVRMCNNRKIHE